MMMMKETRRRRKVAGSLRRSDVNEEGETAMEMMPEDGNTATVGLGTTAEEDEVVDILENLVDIVRERRNTQRSIAIVRMNARNRKHRKIRFKELAAASASTFARVQNKEEVRNQFMRMIWWECL
ncbi:hypothetical protein MKX03_024153 [Papaver bracteatum]|nr:hypothetical protein MKX03_024153 [Papaver bracteatum]